jgi:hypothetical protein
MGIIIHSIEGIPIFIAIIGVILEFLSGYQDSTETFYNKRRIK